MYSLDLIRWNDVTTYIAGGWSVIHLASIDSFALKVARHQSVLRVISNLCLSEPLPHCDWFEILYKVDGEEYSQYFF